VNRPGHKNVVSMAVGLFVLFLFCSSFVLYDYARKKKKEMRFSMSQQRVTHTVPTI